ncbi:MAG: hypothetical protein AABZ53_07320 [Planctomycetota bacterium]
MRHPLRSIRVLTSLLVLAGATLAGCSTSHTFVLDPAMPRMSHMTAALQQGSSTVKVDEKTARAFEAKLGERLRTEAKITASPTAELVIQYRFVLYETGSTAARLGSGVASLAGSPFYGIGDGTVGIEATFTDALGHPMGRILVDGPIAGAFASADSALDTAATSIARYTRANFVDTGMMGKDAALAAK